MIPTFTFPVWGMGALEIEAESHLDNTWILLNSGRAARVRRTLDRYGLEMDLLYRQPPSGQVDMLSKFAEISVSDLY